MSNPFISYVNSILQCVKRDMYGMDDVIRLSLVALFTGGHVLLEGNPGLGKTMMVRSLADALQLEFKRIQFTPDLMPTDIIGTSLPVHNNGEIYFDFKPGPIFTSLLLADEINRATPKTQSAMLEAMAEKRVTPPGCESKDLPKPFMVLATQNPIEQQGTFELPEAQADRFMFKILMPQPNAAVISRIMLKDAGRVSGFISWEDQVEEDGNTHQPQPLTASIYEEIEKAIKEKAPTTGLELHIANMYLASNGRFSELQEVNKKEKDKLERLVCDLVRFGLGPRAATALLLGAKAYTVLFPPELECADGPAMLQVALPVLRHRVKMDFGWQEIYKKTFGKKEQEEGKLHDCFLMDFVYATAPVWPDYHHSLKRFFPTI
jgi:MoxR-like ATPase